MNHKITKNEEVFQFTSAIQLYFEWIEQREDNDYVLKNTSIDSDE